MVANPASDIAVPESVDALVRSRLASDAWKKVDQLDDLLKECTERGLGAELPLRHIFTPGLYTREIFLPAGALITTRIHLKEHPFVLSRGVVSVWDDVHGWQRLSAPFTGVTAPGTRRVLYIHEPAIWTTFHVTDKNDPDDVVRDITFSEGKFSELGIASAHRFELPSWTS